MQNCCAGPLTKQAAEEKEDERIERRVAEYIGAQIKCAFQNQLSASSVVLDEIATLDCEVHTWMLFSAELN